MVVSREPLAGTVVETSGPLAVVLETGLTPELEAEGLARDLVSRIQQLRKEAGLEVTDRIALRWNAESAMVAAAFDHWSAYLAGEVLAESIERSETLAIDDDVSEHRVGLSVQRSE